MTLLEVTVATMPPRKLSKLILASATKSTWRGVQTFMLSTPPQKLQQKAKKINPQTNPPPWEPASAEAGCSPSPSCEGSRGQRKSNPHGGRCTASKPTRPEGSRTRRHRTASLPASVLAVRLRWWTVCFPPSEDRKRTEFCFYNQQQEISCHISSGILKFEHLMMFFLCKIQTEKGFMEVKTKIKVSKSFRNVFKYRGGW